MAKNIAHRSHGRYIPSRGELVVLHSTLNEPRANQIFEFITINFKRTIEQFGDNDTCVYEFDYKEYKNGTIRTVYLTRKI